MKKYWKRNKSSRWLSGGGMQSTVGKIWRNFFSFITHCLLPIAYCLLLVIGTDSCFRRKDYSATETYTCSMHPTVVQDNPGTCPVCGMDLVPKAKHSQNPERIAELDYLLKPVNATIISSIKTISPVQKSMDETLKINGIIVYDTRALVTISSRFGGRVEKLFINHNLQQVKRGQPVLEVYSPELLTAQRDLLYLMKSDKENGQLIEGAKEKLRLLGASDDQIGRLISTGRESNSFIIYSNATGYIAEPQNSNGQNELQVRAGMYITAGQTLFKIADDGKVWAEFDVYAKDVSSIKLNDPLRLESDDMSQGVEGRVDFIQPFYKNGESFTKVRVYLQNNNGQFRIGQWVSASFDKSLKGSMWIPLSAQLDLGTKKIVFIRKAGIFQPQEIHAGRTSNEWVEVTGGIDARDSLAYNAQFLVDSESFIKIKN